MKTSLVTQVDKIQERIYRIRGKKVMLSHHLASLYEVPHKALIQAVKRNIKRFPEDFMFQLNETEFRSLRSQIVTLEMGRGRYPKYRSYAFTEQGIAMLSAVLRSDRAIRVSIDIVRVFVKLREFVLRDQSLVRRINAMEKKFDGQFQTVFQAIRELIGPDTAASRRRIGFRGEGL
jgi:phage regulator Rha-like protein